VQPLFIQKYRSFDMATTLPEIENILDALLPSERLKQKPPVNLLKATERWSETIWDMAAKLGPIPLTAEQLKQGIILSGNGVFICGVHRSGTTLLRDLLDGHPDLVVLPSEGTYYTNLETKLKKLPEHKRMALLGQEWLRRLVNPINQPPYWLLGHSSSKHSLYVDFARYFMAWWSIVNHKIFKHWPHIAVILAYASVTNKLNAACWVDKSPMNEQFLDRIWQEMPKARVIHLIRNPYAVVSSRKKMEPTVSLRSILKNLHKSYTIAAKQNALNDAQFMLSHYEDICEDTSRFIERLTAFLNIKPEPTLLSPTVAGNPVRANSSFITNAVAGQIISPTRYERPELLSPYEKEVLEAYLKYSARKTGYELTGTNYLRGAFIKFGHMLTSKYINI